MGIRIVAFFAKLFGGLTLLGGAAGFVTTFIKTAPDIFTTLQYLHQRFGLFFLTIIATYLGIFMGLGCAGLITIGLGFLLDSISSRPTE